MENEYRNRETDMTRKGSGLLIKASNSFLANLPLLVCGTVVGLAVIMDMLA